MNHNGVCNIKIALYTMLTALAAIIIVLLQPLSVHAENDSVNYALKFSSDDDFTLEETHYKQWDGIIEYSDDDGETWNEWDGNELTGYNNCPIYLRGINNTVITGGYNFIFTGKYCTGNIENLLDYQTVANGEHPDMDEFCFDSMFNNCESLLTAPELPAIELTGDCYESMFAFCSSLTTAPDLPATELADYCYKDMFYGCTSLTTPPELPATTLTEQCYADMFHGCTSLTKLPTIPAVINTENYDCCKSMFEGCLSVKLSDVQTGEYQYPYYVVASPLTLDPESYVDCMFDITGGTFNATPEFNHVYYLTESPIGTLPELHEPAPVLNGTMPSNAAVLTLNSWDQEIDFYWSVVGPIMDSNNVPVSSIEWTTDSSIKNNPQVIIYDTYEDANGNNKTMPCPIYVFPIITSDSIELKLYTDATHIYVVGDFRNSEISASLLNRGWISYTAKPYQELSILNDARIDLRYCGHDDVNECQLGIYDTGGYKLSNIIDLSNLNLSSFYEPASFDEGTIVCNETPLRLRYHDYFNWADYVRPVRILKMPAIPDNLQDCFTFDTDGLVYLDDNEDMVPDGDNIGDSEGCVSDDYMTEGVFIADNQPHTYLIIEPTMFCSGKDFNVTIKELAGCSHSLSTTQETTITDILWADSPWENIESSVRVDDSYHHPIYARLLTDSEGNKIVELYTEAIMAQLNNDSSYMFCNFKELKKVSFLSSDKIISTSTVTNMSSMFYGCDKLAAIDNISNWDVSHVTDISNMFSYCNKLGSLDLSYWNVSNVTNMSKAFYYSWLTSIGNVSNWDVSNVTDMSSMFYSCDFTSLNISAWNTFNVTDMGGMFSSCQNLTTIDLSGWDVSKVTNISSMFADCNSLTTVTGISDWNLSSNKSTRMLFSSCKKLTNIGNLSGWDTSKVTDMGFMFTRCNKLTAIGDLSNWNVSNVTNMSSMFAGCYIVTTVGDLSNWNVSNVTDMSMMFFGCDKLTTIGNLSNWNVSNVTNMDSMFSGCYKLTTVGDLSNWNVSNVTDMGYMFQECKKLATVGDISNWDVSHVTDMHGMFQSCLKFPLLDLSSWDVSSVKQMSLMFYNCPLNFDISQWNPPLDMDSTNYTYSSIFCNSGFTELDFTNWTCFLNRNNLSYLNNLDSTFCSKYALKIKNLAVSVTYNGDKIKLFGYYYLDDNNDDIPDSPLLLTKILNDGQSHTYIRKDTVANVSYIKRTTNSEEQTKCAHTNNILDDKTKIDTYASNLTTKDTITIVGSESLHVTLTYGTEEDWDWLIVMKGNYTGEVPSATLSSTDDAISALKNSPNYIGGYTGCSNSPQTVEFDVESDTVTFIFRSETNTEYYGYYATITGNSYAGEYTDLHQFIKKGNKVNEPLVSPTENGMEFAGWKKYGESTLFDFANTPINEDIILVAEFVSSDAVITNAPAADHRFTLMIKQLVDPTITDIDADDNTIHRIQFTPDPWENVENSINVAEVGKVYARAVSNDDNTVNIELYSPVETVYLEHPTGLCKNMHILRQPWFIEWFDTSRVTDITSLFEGCTKISQAQLRNIQFPNITRSTKAFKDTEITLLNQNTFKNWNLAACEDRCDSMFEGCENLDRYFANSGMEYISDRMFYGCEHLSTIYGFTDVCHPIGENAFYVDPVIHHDDNTGEDTEVLTSIYFDQYDEFESADWIHYDWEGDNRCASVFELSIPLESSNSSNPVDLGHGITEFDTNVNITIRQYVDLSCETEAYTTPYFSMLDPTQNSLEFGGVTFGKMFGVDPEVNEYGPGLVYYGALTNIDDYCDLCFSDCFNISIKERTVSNWESGYRDIISDYESYYADVVASETKHIVTENGTEAYAITCAYNDGWVTDECQFIIIYGNKAIQGYFYSSNVDTNAEHISTELLFETVQEIANIIPGTTVPNPTSPIKLTFSSDILNTSEEDLIGEQNISFDDISSEESITLTVDDIEENEAAGKYYLDKTYTINKVYVHPSSQITPIRYAGSFPVEFRTRKSIDDQPQNEIIYNNNGLFND